VTISQTVEYALRAIVWIASHPPAALGTPEIARATRVPPGYLSKVLQALGRGKLVVSQPGRRGGFVLARPADQITVLDVFEAVDPIAHIRKCPLNIASHAGELCPLHRRLEAALAHVEQAFAGTTIAELLAEARVPLCEDGAGSAGDVTVPQAPAGRRRGRSRIRKT
jgi:Rrf2 family nitric oxide-sensitive transcriptional repressor